jgi:molybdopterin-guanine dinucleotide biosynthesis protein MobB
MPRPPMIAIVGSKKHGKTTLTVRLTAELHRRGHRAMTIKHGSHTFNIDPATTDTYRHYHEGQAAKVAMVSPDKFALVERWHAERSPEEIAERYMADADVVVCEGFKASWLPKIEIFRREAGGRPLYDAGSPIASTWRAVVTDDASLAVDVPVISFSEEDWLVTLADLVEHQIMGRA